MKNIPVKYIQSLIEDPTIPPHSFFNVHFGLVQNDMKRILETALSKGGEFAELFFEYRIFNTLHMEEDILKESTEHIGMGLGIRVIRQDQTGFAYTNELIPNKMEQAARTAASIANQNMRTEINLIYQEPNHQYYDFHKPLHAQSFEQKYRLLQKAYTAAQKYDPHIEKVQASLVDEIRLITIVNNEGLFISDIRPQVRLAVRTTALEKNNRNTGFATGGGRIGFGYFESVNTPESLGEKAAEEAILLLSAIDPPAGEQPVVLGCEHSGVMIHEAVGHPLEADANRKKTSIMWDKFGQHVANPIVTIYDDPTIPHLRGSLNIDDEGTKTKKCTLIEKGKLVGLLHDRLSAKIMNMEPNGHGRRGSYQNIPIPRMTNTVLARGNSEPEEIIGTVKNGFYAKSYQGGQVQNSGKFTFSVNLGYLIENGKLTRPVKNATLIGTNVQVLNQIQMIGNDMGYFLGTCGKEGQSSPVTAGTPTFKIGKMTVGGR